MSAERQTAERAEIVAYAGDYGTAAAAERFGVAASTIRSWRHRAAERTGPVTVAAELVDVQIAGGGWDSAGGCERTVAARARPVERWIFANDSLARLPLRDLGMPSSVGPLRTGDLIVLGGARNGNVPEAVFEVVEPPTGTWRDRFDYRPTLPRPLSGGMSDDGPSAADPDEFADWIRVTVQEARLDRPGVKLFEERDRIETERHDPAAAEREKRERMARQVAGWDSQPPLHGEVEGRERQAAVDLAHPLS
ncbi:MAG: hypothetical protein ACR2KV_09865 [Solirubrobacteraceae bacterium]